MTFPAEYGSMKTTQILLDSDTANTQSITAHILRGKRTIEAFITGTGAVSATITWYGCNTRRTVGGILFATTSLSDTNAAYSGGGDTSSTPIAEWPYVYCVLSAISGTGAAVTATVGV